MTSVGAELSQIAQEELPSLADDFPDTMSIVSETVTVGSGGGQIKGGTHEDYFDVPVIYEPLGSGLRSVYADRLVSSAGYKLTMPTHNTKGRIDVDIKTHTFIVAARGDEPEKTFRAVDVLDNFGVYFEVIADKEN